MNTETTETKTRRVMLMHLKPGQLIDLIVFDCGIPTHTQTEITHIETHCNFGRPWTTRGPLGWQMLSFKYWVVEPRKQNLPMPSRSTR